MLLLSQWVPYITDPIFLIGLFLIVAMLSLNHLLKTQKLKHLPAGLEQKVPSVVWQHSYLVGVLLMCAGLMTTHRALEQAQQKNALSQLLVEYDQNLSTIQQLSDNIAQLQQAHRTVSDSLRTGDSKILNIMFPSDKRPEDTQFNTTQVVENSFNQLRRERLFNSKPDMAAFNADKDDIRPKINQQHNTLKAVQDLDGNTYVIKEQAWFVNKAILDEMNEFSAPDYEDHKMIMNDLRDEYDLVTNHAGDFINETKSFIQRNTFIANGDVYEIMNKEKQSLQALTNFGAQLNTQMQALQAMRGELNELLTDLSS